MDIYELTGKAMGAVGNLQEAIIKVKPEKQREATALYNNIVEQIRNLEWLMED